ncbi:hypothetical protein GCM10009785_26630 [Brooklawnia cerclae]|uniref:DUF1640 domain-containing protein n=1 Tax=Brooklawnia cerclae TaxID=349934 RepID=A0ABX0SG22_9ACTN|nr:hypothetical protein [Brooklawnia cerclae]NIH57328.1 hypothetical protein [Brooklawnia cerclae]
MPEEHAEPWTMGELARSYERLAASVEKINDKLDSDRFVTRAEWEQRITAVDETTAQLRAGLEAVKPAKTPIWQVVTVGISLAMMMISLVGMIIALINLAP